VITRTAINTVLADVAAPTTPTTVRDALADARRAGALPRTGAGEGGFSDSDLAWLFSLASLGAGIVLAVLLRRALMRRNE
jgi:hypothetical protein